MKILVLSESGYGAWFAWLFKHEGHKVDYVVKPKYKNILSGIAPLPYTKLPISYSQYDLAVFDMTGNGDLANKILDETNVIGDSILADRLEDDRQFGLQVMEKNGIAVPPWQQFNDVKEAARFVKATGKRYVFKPSGDDQDCAATYVSTSAEDLLDYFNSLTKLAKGTEFVLQEFIAGTEVSTEAFFNGKDWYFINNTFEEKKFMDGGIGPNTGCSGNLVYSHGMSEPRIFKQTLKKLTQFLQEQNYYGMIDLNAIVTDTDCYGLEWTPRFGYDASATQTLLIRNGYANFIAAIASGQSVNADTFVNGFAASIRLSIPPYPLITDEKNVYQKDVPINGLEESDLPNCYLYDVYLNNKDDLVSCGHEGFICSPAAYAEDATYAFELVQKMIDRIKIPNMQYRTDIAKKSISRYEKLKQAGWFSYST